MKNILFHITGSRRLPNILDKGLLVNSNIQGIMPDNLFPHEYIERYGMQPIFLTKTPIFMLLYHSAIQRYNYNTIIIEVDSTNLKLRYETPHNLSKKYHKNIKCDKDQLISRVNISPCNLRDILFLKKETIDAILEFRQNLKSTLIGDRYQYTNKLPVPKIDFERYRIKIK